MTSITLSCTLRTSEGRTAVRTLLTCVALAVFGLASSSAHAQSVGIATMQAGTLAHTVASSIAKALKEKGGIHALVQPTAGESIAIALVGRAETELGLANAPEVAIAIAGGTQSKLRLIGAFHPDSRRDVRAQRQPDEERSRSQGQARDDGLFRDASRRWDDARHSGDGRPDSEGRPIVLVPNIIRSADDFLVGAADMLFAAFGAPQDQRSGRYGRWYSRARNPKLPGMATADRISSYGYLTEVRPSPFFHRHSATNESILHRSSALHARRSIRRRGLQDDRYSCEQQRRPYRRRPRPTRILGVIRSTTSRTTRVS